MKSIAALLFLTFATTLPARTWTSADGSQKIEADLVSKATDSIVIKMADGRTTNVKVALFCAADQEYVASWQGNSGDWPAWRGPNGNNVAPAGSSVPTEFGETSYVIWKADIPGRGASSPVVVGNRVFVTTADDSNQVQSVVCLDRDNGKQLWQTEVHRGSFSPKMHRKNTHATPTPAWDGERLVVPFYNDTKVKLSALDLDGKILWQTVAGTYLDQYQYGYAASPVLYGSTVIVSSEYDEGFIAAFDRGTGKEVWRKPRGGNSSYSSPIVAKAGGRDLLVLTGNDTMTAYDPRNGSQTWVVSAIAKATCGTVTWDGDLLFASGGYPKKETVAVNAKTGQVVWRNLDKSYEQSMLASGGYLYTLNDNATAICWRASDGEEMWKDRLGGQVSASPVLVGDKIIASNEKGEFFVIKANPQQLEVLHRTQIGNESFASPAISGNRMFLRVASGRGIDRQETLYCIGGS